MKISIITIVYNDVTNIEKTLRSVVNQSAFDYIQYIVIDGGSTDGTSDIIRNYSNYIDIYIREKDSGIYNAMNKGLKEATGDYILYINSGDSLASDGVIGELREKIAGSDPDVIYGNYREIDYQGNSTKIIKSRDYSKIWYGPVASHQSTLYRLGFLREHGFCYDESYRIAADYKLSAQSILSATSILRTDICISLFDTSGISSTNQNTGLKEANRVRREVMGWNSVKIGFLTIILLGARMTKKYLNPIYSLIR